MKIYDVIKDTKKLTFNDDYGSWKYKEEEVVVTTFEHEDDAKAFIEKYPVGLRIQEREFVLHSEFDINNNFGIYVPSQDGEKTHNLTSEEFNMLQAHLSPGGDARNNSYVQVSQLDGIKSVSFDTKHLPEKYFSDIYGSDTYVSNIHFENGVIMSVVNHASTYTNAKYEFYTFLEDNGELLSVGPKKIVDYQVFGEGEEVMSILKNASTQAFAEFARNELEKEFDIAYSFEEIPDLKRILTKSTGYSEENGVVKIDFRDYYGGFSVELSRETLLGTDRLSGENVVEYQTKVFYSTKNDGEEIEIPNMGLSFKISDIPLDFTLDKEFEDGSKLQNYLEFLSSADPAYLLFDSKTHFVELSQDDGMSRELLSMIKERENELLKENLVSDLDTLQKQQVKDDAEITAAPITEKPEAVEPEVEKYKVIRDIEGNSTRISDFIKEHAVDYIETGENSAKIIFESGSNIYVHDGKFIPYSVVDGIEKPISMYSFPTSDNIDQRYKISGIIADIEGYQEGKTNETLPKMITETSINVEEYMENITLYNKIYAWPELHNIINIANNCQTIIEQLDNDGMRLVLQSEQGKRYIDITLEDNPICPYVIKSYDPNNVSNTLQTMDMYSWEINPKFVEILNNACTQLNIEGQQYQQQQIIEDYNILNKIDASGGLSNLVNNTALSYYEDKNTAKIVFDNGNGILIKDSHIIPFHTINEQEVPICIAGPNIESMTTGEIGEIIKLAQSSSIIFTAELRDTTVTTEEERMLIKDKSITLTDLTENPNFFRIGYELLGQDIAKVYSMAQENEMQITVRDTETMKGFVVQMTPEGTESNMLVCVEGIDNKVTIYHAVEDRTNNSLTFPEGEISKNATREDAISTLDRIIETFEAEKTAESSKEAVLFDAMEL